MQGYRKDSLILRGAVALGTGVMIGAGIFALLGQVAELSGTWFPYIFIVGAILSGFRKVLRNRHKPYAKRCG
jgi:amino acid transporter